MDDPRSMSAPEPRPGPRVPRHLLLRRSIALLGGATAVTLVLHTGCWMTNRETWPTLGVWLGAASLAFYGASYALSRRADRTHVAAGFLLAAGYANSLGLDAARSLSGGSIIGYGVLTLLTCLLFGVPAAAGVASLGAASHLLLEVLAPAAGGPQAMIVPLTDAVGLAAGLGAIALYADPRLEVFGQLPTWTRRSLRRLARAVSISPLGAFGEAQPAEEPTVSVPTPVWPSMDDTYRHLFEDSPTPMWEMDLSALRRRIDELRAEGVVDLASYLRESPRLLRELGEEIRIGRMNMAALGLLRAAEVATTRRSLPELLGRLCQEPLAEIVVRLVSGETAIQMTCSLPRLSGEPVDVVLALQVAPGSRESWDTVLVSATDVTEHLSVMDVLRRRVERYVELAQENARLVNEARDEASRKEALLHELSHRARNNLASIMGLLYTEARQAGQGGSPDPVALAYDIARRVQGLVTVHDLLSDHDWQSLPIDSLMRAIIDGPVRMAPSSHPVVATVAPSPVLVTPNQANTLALVVNELATNSLKHALRRGQTTHISVTTVREGADIVVYYRDDGDGYPEEVLAGSSHGTGLQLTRSMVRQQLRGELSLHNEGGALAVIRFPAPQNEGSA